MFLCSFPSFKQTSFYWFISYLTATTTSDLPYDEWTQYSSPILPLSISHNAIGRNPSNHTIWIIGDYGSSNFEASLVSFDYINNVFTDHGATGLGLDVYGRDQNYAQIGNTLYFTDSWFTNIHSFNMETMVFNYSYHTFIGDTVYGDRSGPYSCIVSIRNEYLAVLGSDRNVQILNISSHNWLVSVPSMIEGRSTASCIYINDKMFIVGGWDSFDYYYLPSIEYLNVSISSMNNIASMLWMNNSDPLPHVIIGSRCVTVDDDILVIGGRTTPTAPSNTNPNDTLNTIYVIQSITGTVSLGGYLAHRVAFSAVVVVNNIVYSFGSESWNGWQTKAVSPMTTEPNDITTPFTRASTNVTTFSSASTNVTVFKDSVSIKEVNEKSDNDNNNGDNNELWFILFLIVLSVCVIITLCGSIGICIKNRKNQQIYKASQNNMQMNPKPKPKPDDKVIVQFARRQNEPIPPGVPPSKCIQCGAESKQNVEGIFVCLLCKSFENEKVDKVVDKMFDENMKITEDVPQPITRKYDDEGVINEDNERNVETATKSITKGRSKGVSVDGNDIYMHGAADA